MDAKVSNGFVVTDNNGFAVADGIKLEPASNIARNEFGNEEGMTWEEADRMGFAIQVSENGEPFISDPRLDRNF